MQLCISHKKLHQNKAIEQWNQIITQQQSTSAQGQTKETRNITIVDTAHWPFDDTIWPFDWFNQTRTRPVRRSIERQADRCRSTAAAARKLAAAACERERKWSDKWQIEWCKRDSSSAVYQCFDQIDVTTQRRVALRWVSSSNWLVSCRRRVPCRSTFSTFLWERSSLYDSRASSWPTRISDGAAAWQGVVTSIDPILTACRRGTWSDCKIQIDS